MDKILLNFFSNYKLFSFKRNETIVRSDTENNIYVYFIKKGLVRLYVHTITGSEINITVLKPNSYFPMITCMNNLPNRFNFGAVTETQVYRAPSPEVISYIQNNNELTYDLAKRLGRGLDGMTKIIESIAINTARNKILMYFYLMMKRFGAVEKSSVALPLKTTHKDIANSVGLTRETVTRELKQIMNEKILQKSKGRYMATNMKELENMLGVAE